MGKDTNKNISQLIKSINELTNVLKNRDVSLLSAETRKAIDMEVSEIESKILSHEYNWKSGRAAYQKAEQKEQEARKVKDYEAYQKARAEKNALKEFSPEYQKKQNANLIMNGVRAITGSIFTVLETQIKKQTIKLQTTSELQNRAIETYGKTLNNAIGVQIGNVTSTVLDTAFNSLTAVIEGGRSIFMKNISDAISIRKQANQIAQANAQMADSIVNSVGSVVTSIPGPVGLIGTALTTMASLGTKAAMLEAERTALNIKLDEEIQKSQNNQLEQIESIVKRYSDMSKEVTKSFLDVGKSAYQYARTLGISSETLRLYHDSLIEGINVQLSAFGMNIQDYIKMQESYNEANGGRSSILSTREAMMLGGLSMRLGISVDQAATITGSMNVFNTSIADGSELMYSMAKTANRMGLSANKFAKDLEKNLKLAEKYQFRGGVRGMMEMALWAQRTRFNIDEMSSLQEKMIGGNIEDVMQTSARLNVLGGNAALYSNPMALLFNGVSNPAALAKNINSMVSGYGTFNRDTGETEFSFNEMLRLNAIAQGLGMSRENLMNQARQAQKADVIKRKYGSKFGKNIEGVAQHATWSVDKKDWIIKVNNPNVKEGYEEVALSSLNKDDKRLQNIFPEDKQDMLIDYVREIRNFLSVAEQQSASEKKSISEVMGLSNEKGLTTVQAALAEERLADTERNKDKLSNLVIDFAEQTLESQKKINKFTTELDAEKLVESYLKFTDSNFNQLLDETKKFVESGANIEKMLRQIEATYKNTSLDVIDKRKKQQIENLNDWDNIMKIMNKKHINDVEIENRLKNGEYFFDENEMLKGINSKGEIVSIEQKTYSVAANQRRKRNIESMHNVDDAVITPRGTVYTHPDDMIAAFKPDGAIMNGLKNGVSKIEVDGTLMLKTDNGQQVNLIELLRSDPESIRRITEAVIIEANKNNYGGRSKHAPGRYSIN